MMAKQELKKQREPEKLHERYGKIGISAVVAVNIPGRCQKSCLRPRHAPRRPVVRRSGVIRDRRGLLRFKMRVTTHWAACHRQPR